MSNLALAAVLCVFAAAPALAAERISDGELVRASRCLGLSKAANLGPVDATALQAFVKAQGKSRDLLVQDRAETAERAARSEAGRAKGAQKDALIAERDGACKAMVTAASTAGPAGA
jgi:hypothetical protein